MKSWKMKGIKIPSEKSKTNGAQRIGNEDQEGSWTIRLFKKSAPNGKKTHAGWSTDPDKLRSQLIKRGPKFYKTSKGKCLN